MGTWNTRDENFVYRSQPLGLSERNKVKYAAILSDMETDLYKATRLNIYSCQDEER